MKKSFQSAFGCTNVQKDFFYLGINLILWMQPWAVTATLKCSSKGHLSFFLYLPSSGIAPCVRTAGTVHDAYTWLGPAYWGLLLLYPLSHHGWMPLKVVNKQKRLTKCRTVDKIRLECVYFIVNFFLQLRNLNYLKEDWVIVLMIMSRKKICILF